MRGTIHSLLRVQTRVQLGAKHGAPTSERDHTPSLGLWSGLGLRQGFGLGLGWGASRFYVEWSGGGYALALNTEHQSPQQDAQVKPQRSTRRDEIGAVGKRPRLSSTLANYCTGNLDHLNHQSNGLLLSRSMPRHVVRRPTLLYV